MPSTPEFGYHPTIGFKTTVDTERIRNIQPARAASLTGYAVPGAPGPGANSPNGAMPGRPLPPTPAY